MPTIIKVTSGSSPEVAEFVDTLYRSVIVAGTHRASSIRVADAAKVIENTQRDVNVSIINELALIFDRLGIDILEVLEAAGSKWNFLPFRPSLVWGHCIGVDPYYLTYEAQAIGCHPEIILAGGRLNDSMGSYVVSQVIKLMMQLDGVSKANRAFVLGLTFKENCPDLRNTRVVDIVGELRDYGIACDVYDPWASAEDALAEYGIRLTESLVPGAYDAVILAVAHHECKAMAVEELRAMGKPGAVLCDVEQMFPHGSVDGRL